ncbi:hypothetical protein rosag_20260 [Roseisolibacter agri]|uniref:Uncharacterized protein n=1 Tax=Roseisolibacter agri TaxID=2014610 RepID=A0AA37VAJ8_9BACT|nr:hypothetical protein rosag_20260 [Roseisolibacter agri]
MPAAAQHPAEDPAQAATAEDAGERVRALGLARPRRHAAEHHRKRRLDGLLRGGGVGAHLLADLLDLLRPELLMDEVEKAHGTTPDRMGSDRAARDRGRGPPLREEARRRAQRPVTANSESTSVWLLSETREPPRWMNCCM